MSRTVPASFGMIGEVCAGCFERPRNCLGCVFRTCPICKEEFYEGEMYEYRGVLACEKDFEAVIKKRDYQRQQVMETTEKSIRSQSDGEWNNGGYKTMKVDKSGRPIPTKTKEPQALKDYEDGKL